MEEQIEQSFNFCIAKEWYPGTSNTHLSVYAYGSHTFYGTMAQAVHMREFIAGRANEPEAEYNIYKLVKVELPVKEKTKE